MKKVLSFLLCFVFLLSFSACGTEEQQDKPNNLSAEQTIQKYFEYWNKRDEKGMKSFLSAELKEVDFKLGNLTSIKLDEVKKVEKISAEYNQYFEYAFYDVTFTSEYKNGGAGGLDNGTYTWQYALVKYNSTANWTIKSYQA